MFAIGVSCIQLAFESPLNDANSRLARTLTYVDIVTTFIFTVEFAIKVIASGFAFNG